MAVSFRLGIVKLQRANQNERSLSRQFPLGHSEVATKNLIDYRHIIIHSFRLGIVKLQLC